MLGKPFSFKQNGVDFFGKTYFAEKIPTFFKILNDDLNGVIEALKGKIKSNRIHISQNCSEDHLGVLDEVESVSSLDNGVNPGVESGELIEALLDLAGGSS